MGKYLTKHATEATYEAAASNLAKPHVALTVDDNKVHYMPNTPSPTPTAETRVVATFNVKDTSEEIDILYDESNINSIEIDEVVQPSIITSYTFNTLGEHTIKYTLSDPTSIGDNAFEYCSSLTSIYIPNSVINIGDGAFASCGLISIDIPDSVTTIGDSAFSTYKLTSCTIGSGVTTIGGYAFSECDLASLTIEALTPPTIDVTTFEAAHIETIYVPSASVDIYKAAEYWSDYAETIQAIQQ